MPGRESGRGCAPFELVVLALVLGVGTGCSQAARSLGRTINQAPEQGEKTVNDKATPPQSVATCPKCGSTNVTVTYEHKCPNGTTYTWLVSSPPASPITGRPVNIKCPGCGGPGSPVVLVCNQCGNKVNY
jgi:hypothetical protein